MPTVGRTNFQFRIVKKGNSMKEISQYQGHIHWHAYLFILYSYPPTSDFNWWRSPRKGDKNETFMPSRLLIGWTFWWMIHHTILQNKHISWWWGIARRIENCTMSTADKSGDCLFLTSGPFSRRFFHFCPFILGGIVHSEQQFLCTHPCAPGHHRPPRTHQVMLWPDVLRGCSVEDT